MSEPSGAVGALLLLLALAARNPSATVTSEPAACVPLPPAVEEAFRTAFPRGELVDAKTTVEGGITVYELAFKDGAVAKHADIRDDGTMLEVSTE